MSAEEYLKLILKDKKLKLEHLHMRHQINIAVYDAKRQMIMTDIDNLEKQLNDNH